MNHPASAIAVLNAEGECLGIVQRLSSTRWGARWQGMVLTESAPTLEDAVRRLERLHLDAGKGGGQHAP